jgi:alpha-L-fucosidase
MRYMTLDQRLISVVPGERQFQFQQTEFYAFVHFTVNTFTGLEWGEGSESPSIFNPEKLDARQWAMAVKSAGMKGMVLTCKHHDGFCLWPSRHTGHTIAASPYKGGHGDIVREVSDACQEAGLKFGVYLSPWDRNSALYGQGKPYDDYFIAQLTELLTGYGEVFEVWFDGACAEGPNGKKQYYDWPRYYETIRNLQPGACISVCGPDVRWCGNEAGDTRESEWSVVPRRMMDTEKVAAESQQEDSAVFRQRKLSAHDRDLGSREALADEPELIWYPAEVNTSIRPGWFYHEEEDGKVRTLAELIYIYEHSVGGNGTFLLNIPPTREGLFHLNDVARLREFGAYLKGAYGTNLAAASGTRFSASEQKPGCEIENAQTPGYDAYYMPPDGTTAVEITVNWRTSRTIRRVVLQENILLSQRIEGFAVDVLSAGKWKQVYKGTVVGYKHIVDIETVKTSAVRIRILDSRVAPTLAFLGVF